jgi:hypothetical protein
VPTEVRDLLTAEQDAIIAKGGSEYVFCGPLYDNTGVLRIAEGQCASNEDLGSLSWSVDGIEDLGNFVVTLGHKSNYLSDLQRRWCLALGILGLTVAIVYWGLLYFWRESTVIQFSQRKFLCAVLLGSMCALSTDIVLAFDPSELTCGYVAFGRLPCSNRLGNSTH